MKGLGCLEVTALICVRGMADRSSDGLVNCRSGEVRINGLVKSGLSGAALLMPELVLVTFKGLTVIVLVEAEWARTSPRFVLFSRVTRTLVVTVLQRTWPDEGELVGTVIIAIPSIEGSLGQPTSSPFITLFNNSELLLKRCTSPAWRNPDSFRG